MINNRQNGRRRGRGGQQARNGQPGGPERGNRLDNRARGNAAQLLEKYKTLARDAQMQGDRVNTEYYLQFADHYFRVLAETRSRFEEQRRPRDDYRGDDYEGEADGEARGYEGRDDGDWDEGDAPSQPQPQAQFRPRRDERRDEGDRGGQERGAQERAAPDRGGDRAGAEARGEERNERRPRRNGQRNGNGGGSGERYEAAADEAERALPERIELDRLPPAFAAPAAVEGAPEGEAEVPAERPRRRPRRPRETVVADA